jgi:hypothetical protein
VPPAERAVELQQLDLFIDGRDALLVHAVVTNLVARDPDGASFRLAILRREHPAHPDLLALTLLIDALRTQPASPATHTTLTADIEQVDRTLVPAARRLLGEDAAIFLRPLWQTLMAVATNLIYDDTYPRAHASWLCQQYGDWAAVRAAVEVEPGWSAKALLRYRLGLALHHLGEPEAAIRLWLPLGWMDPALFARHAPALPSVTMRDGWEAFERTGPFGEWSEDTTHVATWFPAWLLARHRGLVHLFQAADIPDAGPATQVFRALLALVPLERHGLSDELIAQRRALQRLSPRFFGYYMETMGGRRPNRQVVAE